MREPVKRPLAKGRRGPRNNEFGRPPYWPRLMHYPPQPGDMTEYGWYDAETEREITEYLAGHPYANRDTAIIAVFNIR